MPTKDHTEIKGIGVDSWYTNWSLWYIWWKCTWRLSSVKEWGPH